MISQLISGIIAIFLGTVAVIKFISDPGLVVSVLSLTFGITSLIWVLKARKSLSKGSSLRGFATNFLFTVIFILCFSFWDIIVKMASLGEIYGDIILFPQYLFISLAYIAFVGAAYKIRNIGEEFGFSEQSKEIKKKIGKKKKK